MKLRLITECSPYCLVETQHGWKERGTALAAEQSAENLIYTSLRKIRNMLQPMGLLKGGEIGGEIKKNHVAEPIAPAVAPFDALRRAVRARAEHDTQSLADGYGHPQRVGEFWGFQIPRGHYDVEAGSAGSPNANGQFDEMIRQTVKASKGKPVEAKIELLNQLAQSLM